MNKVQPHAKYRPGDVVTLKAVRASEMGVFLDAGTGNTDDDILLHKLQQETEVKVGDSVKVYLYLDPHGRLTASMKLPKMREGQLGYVKVLSVTRDGGCRYRRRARRIFAVQPDARACVAGAACMG